MKAFVTKCDTCGYEIRNSKASNAIEQFTRKLNEIENNKLDKNLNLKNYTVGNYSYELEKNNKVNEMTCNFIKSYSIPNNKEDLYEFLIMAVSNIDTNYLVKKKKELGVNQESYITNKRLNEAWYVKMKQVYEKAKLTFENDEDFKHISELFLEKNREINIAKNKKLIKKIVIWGVILGVFVFGPIISNYKSRDVAAKKKNELHKIEKCNEEDIMPIFIKDYESVEVNDFNLYITEKVNRDSNIYVDGVCETVFPMIFDNGITVYSMKLKINENQTWLIFLDSEQFSNLEVYKEVVSHKMRVKGRYSGYSNLYKLPAIYMRQVYDYNDGLLITSGTF